LEHQRGRSEGGVLDRRVPPARSLWTVSASHIGCKRRVIAPQTVQRLELRPGRLHHPYSAARQYRESDHHDLS
jgi:hypothetical protein